MFDNNRIIIVWGACSHYRGVHQVVLFCRKVDRHDEQAYLCPQTARNLVILYLSTAVIILCHHPSHIAHHACVPFFPFPMTMRRKKTAADLQAKINYALKYKKELVLAWIGAGGGAGGGSSADQSMYGM